MAGVSQWIECWPENQRVAGSIPSQAHAWIASQVPGGRCMRGNHTLMFLFLSFCLPSPLSKNKEIKSLKKQKFSIHNSFTEISHSPNAETVTEFTGKMMTISLPGAEIQESKMYLSCLHAHFPNLHRWKYHSHSCTKM